MWLPNTRGNTFSRGNFYYSHRDPEYWYRGVDEYALIDNPAMVDKALEVSGASKLAWVGHSQVRLVWEACATCSTTGTCPAHHAHTCPMHVCVQHGCGVHTPT